MKNHEDNFSTHQYKECYESFRQHDRSIWQIPAVVVTIAGGLGVAAFGYVTEWFARGCLFAFGAILTGCLLHAVIKHRYFAMVEQETLCEIEKVAGAKLIQRVTVPDENSEYWYQQKTNNLVKKLSGHQILMVGMIILLTILLGLSVWAFVMAIIS